MRGKYIGAMHKGATISAEIFINPKFVAPTLITTNVTDRSQIAVLHLRWGTNVSWRLYNKTIIDIAFLNLIIYLRYIIARI